jgi:hypothetical protein
MKTFKKYWPVAAYLLLLGVVWGLFETGPSKTEAAPPSGPSNVNIVSWGGTPVGGSSTPTVNAQQSGTWNVGITGTPSVSISGTPSVSGSVGILGTPSVNVANMPTVGIDSLNNTVKLVKEPENPARLPVNHSDWCNFVAGLYNCINAGAHYVVPSNKELVIESVSASVGLPTTQKVGLISFTTQVGGSTVSMYLAPSYQADDGTSAYFLASQQMRMYADPNTVVVPDCSRISTLGGGGYSCDTTFSGYLVDLTL